MKKVLFVFAVAAVCAACAPKAAQNSDNESDTTSIKEVVTVTDTVLNDSTVQLAVTDSTVKVK